MATLPSATSALTTEVAKAGAKGKKVFVIEESSILTPFWMR